MKKTGLADSPFFASPSAKIVPPSGKESDAKEKKNKEPVVDQSVDQPTDRPIDQPVDQSTDQSTNQSTDPPSKADVDVDKLGPIVSRPRAFYITQRVDAWLDEAVRYLKRQGLHKMDRSVLINALLHDPDLFTPEALDALRARLLSHLTNKSIKKVESTE